MDEIRKLAKKECATFYGVTSCFIAGTCRYFRYDIDQPSCRYFETHVLPSDPKLEAKYWGESVDDNVITCEKCGKAIEKRSNRQKFCDRCSAESRKDTNRAAKRRQRVK